MWFKYASENVQFVLRADLRGTICRGLAYGSAGMGSTMGEDMGEKGLV